MNGRIYDPLLGRMLSADILVQAPAILGSYNRYSYVMNNPLIMTDPSGFSYRMMHSSMNPTVRIDHVQIDPKFKAEMDKQVAELCVDIAGTVEPTPTIDLAHATYQFGEGRALDGTLTAAGAVPIVGDVVGKGIKWVAVKPIRGLISLAKRGDDAAKVASNTAKQTSKQLDTAPTPHVDSAAPKPEPVEVSSAHPSKEGGPHSETSKPTHDGMDSNHMPADSVSPWPTGDGPAIKMDPADHKQTASWGSSKAAEEYREKQAKLISEGKYEEAFQMDVDDIREKFGDKYDKAIEQAQAYANELFERWRKENP